MDQRACCNSSPLAGRRSSPSCRRRRCGGVCRSPDPFCRRRRRGESGRWRPGRCPTAGASGRLCVHGSATVRRSGSGRGDERGASGEPARRGGGVRHLARCQLSARREQRSPTTVAPDLPCSPGRRPTRPIPTLALSRRRVPMKRLPMPTNVRGARTRRRQRCWLRARRRGFPRAFRRDRPTALPLAHLPAPRSAHPRVFRQARPIARRSAHPTRTPVAAGQARPSRHRPLPRRPARRSTACRPTRRGARSAWMDAG